jgi:hypothetical protein
MPEDVRLAWLGGTLSQIHRQFQTHHYNADKTARWRMKNFRAYILLNLVQPLSL